VATIGGSVAGSNIGNAILPGIGGIIGGAIGGSVGGVIDQQFVYPALFGHDSPIDGLKVDDMLLQTASEGSPMRLCFGPDNRVAGTVIWMDKVVSRKKQTGGKSGPTVYTYYVNLAILICEGPIYSIDKIWADSKLVYQKSTGDANNNGTLTGTLRTNTGLLLGAKNISVLMSGGGGDSAALKKGDHVRFGTRPTVFEVTADVSIASGATGTLAITPGIDVPTPIDTVISLVDWTDAFYESLSLYTGTAIQNPDPLMESILGAGNVPGYRFRALAVFENFILSPFGNRVPNFTFKLSAQQSKTVASGISDLLVRGNIQSSDFDVTKVTGNIRGYGVSGPQPTGKAVEPLMLAYNVDAQEKDGKLTFFTRTNRETVTCLELDLGAHEAGENAPSSMTIDDMSGFDVPQSISVAFIDKKQNHQKGLAQESRNQSITPGLDVLTLPVVLLHSEARDIANRLLWDAARERLSAEFSLPPSRLGVQEGDLIVVPFKTETYSIRAMDVKLGANFTVQVQGRIEGYLTDDRASVSEDLPASDFPVYTPAPVILQVLDVPSLTDAEVRSWGVYVAACNMDPAGEWRGVTLFYGKNDANLTHQFDLHGEATMGRVVAIDLDIFGADTHHWDNRSTIDVSMWNGTLAGSTDLDVLNGANRMIINREGVDTPEVIGYVNAALVGTDPDHGGPVYRLSRLLRGRRNTFTAMAFEWDVEDICTFINSAVQFAPLSAAEFKKTVFYRAVPAGANSSSYTSQALDFQAKTLIPWDPVNLNISPPFGQRDDNSSLTFTWSRRTRAIDRLFTEASDPDLLNPLVEAPEKYVFELMDQISHTQVTKKVIVVDSSSVTVLGGGMKAALGLGWSALPVSFRVVQASPLVGKGDYGFTSGM
jgi:hypothetical protein